MFRGKISSYYKNTFFSSPLSFIFNLNNFSNEVVKNIPDFEQDQVELLKDKFLIGNDFIVSLDKLGIKDND